MPVYLAGLFMPFLALFQKEDSVIESWTVRRGEESGMRDMLVKMESLLLVALG